jgi:biopolymer transport protein ExbD
MAEIINNETGKLKTGKRRAKKRPAMVDMTPMVDLACLLLTFFMLTTAFSKPKTMEIILPKKGEKGGDEIVAKKTLNILISGNNKVYWYMGLANPNKPEETPTITLTDFSNGGLRKVLLEKNSALFAQIDNLTQKVMQGQIKMEQDKFFDAIKEMKINDRTGPIVLIKADDSVKYSNMVDAIDEMAICDIARYAIVDISDYEKELIQKLNF